MIALTIIFFLFTFHLRQLYYYNLYYLRLTVILNVTSHCNPATKHFVKK